ncbi:MAG: hypothetical protein EOT05_00175 [Candidatus Microsaccharimonas sossegonensis]|uniref:Uncharacterized protein n=1 Tax=Candidatus Microsaccharimonas sossegonensis TaxID=2506948 RepID=A0A4V1J7C2_9BACT|nr:MAG: hypothetical protein EOT05_00175 [Candidatus Microsaccharimonas sossegonensis]
MEQSLSDDLSPQEQRRAEFQQLALDLIDGRYELESEVKQKATTWSTLLSGYSRDNLQLPDFLNLPRNANGISGSMNFEVGANGGETRVSKIIIVPDDALPITIRDDHGIILQELGDSISPLPQTAFVETLYSLFPENVRYKLTVDTAVDVISQLSPESYTVYEFEDDSADYLTKIRVSHTETVDDSIFSLEVAKTIIHPSGHLLGTRMNLSESIQRQIKGVDVTRNNLSIDVSRNASPIIELSFETLSGDKIIPVTLPTRRHIDDVMDAIMRLNEYGFNTPNASA